MKGTNVIFSLSQGDFTKNCEVILKQGIEPIRISLQLGLNKIYLDWFKFSSGASGERV